MSVKAARAAIFDEQDSITGQPIWFSKTSFNNNVFGAWVRTLLLSKQLRETSLPAIDRRDTPGDKTVVSVGSGNISVLNQGTKIPGVDSTSNSGATTTSLLGKGSGTNSTQNQGKLSDVTVKNSGGPLWVPNPANGTLDLYINGKLIGGGYSKSGAMIIAKEMGIPGPVGSKGSATTTTGGSMDLGSVITGLGTAYFNAKYNDTGTVSQTGVDFDIPFVDIVADGTATKKKCRRRRKRLATLSDIRDLAALKSVLGNGEAFKTWIATHPS